MPPAFMNQNSSPPLPPLSSTATQSSRSAATLTSIRSTESTTRLERGGYLKKRAIDNITYRQGCPVDKHSEATVRDEDPIAEKHSHASRDECELSSSTSTTDNEQQQQEAPHPLYVIQKEGTNGRTSRVTKVSKAYSFEDYWSIFDSVVEGCRCINIASACTSGGPSSSFGNSADEEDDMMTTDKSHPRASHPHRSSNTDDNTKPSPTSSAAKVGQDAFRNGNTSSNSILDSSAFQKERQDGQRSLKLLRDLEDELSDDDDFRPAHRTSACFVLHEKDKVNDIFR